MLFASCQDGPKNYLNCRPNHHIKSQSWNFMKVALTKITAYWGQTPPQKSDRMCIHNHFWPTSKRKVFKIGRKSTGASAVILTLGWFSAVLANCGVEFQFFFSSACSLEYAWSMILKQFFTPMHTVRSRVTESKKQSNHVRSCQNLQRAGTAVWWSNVFWFYPQGRQDR